MGLDDILLTGVITTYNDYELALKRIDEWMSMDNPPNEFMTLVYAVEAYENIHYPMD